VLRVHCRDKDATPAGLGGECRALTDYGKRRLDRCLLGEGKRTCAKCKVHCYDTEMQRIRTVMRCAGPRRLWRHLFSRDRPHDRRPPRAGRIARPGRAWSSIAA